MDQISVHEIRVYLALKKADGWRSNKQLGALLEGKVSARTIRLHTKSFRDKGIVSQEATFPGFRFKLTSTAGYGEELERAAERMGL